MKRICIAIAAVLLVAAPAHSKDVATQKIDYKDGDTALTGYLATPSTAGTHPGVLIVHAWRGHSENAQRVAREMAAKGYIAFALDMYGSGVLAQNNGEAMALATPFYKDPALMRRRAQAGLAVLRKQANVDKQRIAAIGFCFGGTTVLELARDGADVAGVVSFHGGLKTRKPATQGAVKAKILVAHGGADPYVPQAEFTAFWTEMKNAGADYQLLILSNAVHAFSDPGAGDDASKGAAYSKSAADRAWTASDAFMATLFAK